MFTICSCREGAKPTVISALNFPGIKSACLVYIYKKVPSLVREMKRMHRFSGCVAFYSGKYEGACVREEGASTPIADDAS